MRLAKWLPTILLYTASMAVLAATFYAGYEPRSVYVASGVLFVIVGRIAAHFADNAGRKA